MTHTLSLFSILFCLSFACESSERAVADRPVDVRPELVQISAASAVNAAVDRSIAASTEKEPECEIAREEKTTDCNKALQAEVGRLAEDRIRQLGGTITHAPSVEITPCENR